MRNEMKEDKKSRAFQLKEWVKSIWSRIVRGTKAVIKALRESFMIWLFKNLRWLNFLGGFLLLIALIWCIKAIPEYQIRRDFAYGFLEPSDLPRLENEYRKTIIQLVGGAVISIGLYFTWRRIRATEKAVIVSEQGQITDRFSKAVEQLGSEKLAVRLGGIYALERIARDSTIDHWTVMEVLSAFVRNYTPTILPERTLVSVLNESEIAKGDPAPIDILAAFTVIGRRIHTQDLESQSVFLAKTYLAGTDLPDASFVKGNLSGADLSNSKLQGANFSFGNLEETLFGESLLHNTDFTSANLVNASFRNVDLTSADFSNSNLQGADLQGANLEKANLANAILQNANMEGASLKGINLQQVNLSNLNLKGADLTGANFDGASAEDSSFQAANMSEVTMVSSRFYHVDFSGVSLYKANLSSAGLNEVNLSNSRLELTNLEGASLEFSNLEKAHLGNVNLKNAQLSMAYFVNASLYRANMQGAYMEDTNLSGANLRGANLSFAQLPGADLKDANLEGVNFRMAKLDQVKNLTIDQLLSTESLVNCTGLSQEMIQELKDKKPSLFIDNEKE